jgi:dyslexia susceptibility 1 candidate gene 1 protein
MPIQPHYVWQETETTLEVRVDIKGVTGAKAEVFATDALLKVNCPPYLLVLDLQHEVDDTHSSATLSTEGVHFKLVKARRGPAFGSFRDAYK